MHSPSLLKMKEVMIEVMVKLRKKELPRYNKSIFLITDTHFGLIGPHQCDAEYPVDKKFYILCIVSIFCMSLLL